jgi:putative transposase
LYGKTFNEDEELRQVLSSYIAFYNQQRLHSSLRYLPPAVFEQRLGGETRVN